jgi:hypothetical protein
VIDQAEILEMIEVAIVELKGVAQPHEIAHFRELALDAKEADTPDALATIYQQVKSLRTFCENRAKSGAAYPAMLPRGRRR